MASEEVKKRFLQEIKLRGYDDKYIDVAEEKEILKIALESGSDLDAARQAMLQICEKHDFIVESAVLNKVRELLQTFVGNDGKLDEREFNDTLSLCKRATGGKKTDRECKITSNGSSWSNSPVHSSVWKEASTNLPSILGSVMFGWLYFLRFWLYSSQVVFSRRAGTTRR